MPARGHAGINSKKSKSKKAASFPMLAQVRKIAIPFKL